MIYYIGLDSTDSEFGGCTTFTISKIIDLLFMLDTTITFINYPSLVRLNPNIPIKTRGNAAVALCVNSRLEKNELFLPIMELVENDFNEFKDTSNKLPCLILLEGEIISILSSYDIYKLSLMYYIDIQQISNLLKNIIDKILIWPKVNQSTIGALAAIDANFTMDFTYELIVYRNIEYYGRKRFINEESIKKADKTISEIFSSFDYYNNRELIAPSGKDPVLIGIRGENASKLVNYLDLLECDEIYNSWTIFRTNQATDAHIQYVNENIAQYSVISSIVTISSYSKDIEGGHVKIQAYINLQSVTLIAFEPTKIIPKKLRLLVPGDKIYIHGSVGSFQESLQINLEFFEIIHLMDHYRIKTPECACGNIMKKLGTFKGYKCSLCKNISFMPIKIQNERSLFLGEKIYASLSSQRHLTRPRKRLHRRNRDVPIKVTYDMIRRLFK